MFYQEKIVKKFLTCPVCNQTYADPRCLPCGRIICNECSKTLLVDSKESQIACSLCSETHIIPENGFCPMIDLTEMLKITPREVYRNKEVDLLRDKLKQIEENSQEFKEKIEIGVDTIKDHCHSLRNQVHLQSESLIETIHKFDEELIAKINEYERECVSNYEINENEIKSKSNNFIDELDKFFSDQVEY